MRKPEKLRLKLVGLALYFAILILWWQLELPCVFRYLTGIPCPTCGLTRAWLAAFRLDFTAAFLQYPMFWCVPVLVLYLLLDGRLFPHPKLNGWVLGLMVAGIFGVYFARLFGFPGVLSPL